MWEKNHLMLFKASLDWLTQGSVEGKQEGECFAWAIDPAELGYLTVTPAVS